MKIQDTDVSANIIESFSRSLLDCLENDVILLGAGPANLTCATLLARAGRKVTIFERHVSPGGGMWGGGMMFPRIVVQPRARHLLDMFSISCSEGRAGLLVADSVQATAALIYSATRAGVAFFNSMTAEDVQIEAGRVTGLVLNWSPVLEMGLHVDPLTVRGRYVVDGTGHDAVACRLVARRGLRLNTADGKVAGEGAMLAENGEKMVVENTGEIFPGLYVLGMAAAQAHGSPRMGPIFGGMLLSGEKLARMLLEEAAAVQK